MERERERGIYIVLYLDDGFCFEDNYSNCLQASNFVKDTLVKAGFVVNEEVMGTGSKLGLAKISMEISAR